METLGGVKAVLGFVGSAWFLACLLIWGFGVQALNIPTKINKGCVEIISDVALIKTGDKVGGSEATLLAKLGIRPFSYGLVIQYVRPLPPPATLHVCQKECNIWVFSHLRPALYGSFLPCTPPPPPNHPKPPKALLRNPSLSLSSLGMFAGVRERLRVLP